LERRAIQKTLMLRSRCTSWLRHANAHAARQVRGVASGADGSKIVAPPMVYIKGEEMTRYTMQVRETASWLCEMSRMTACTFAVRGFW
jgi:hypothetical protein